MILNVVATLIGNLSDISLRAKEVLAGATLMLCEDTRTTKKLLNLLDIQSKALFLSSHAKSSQKEVDKALKECQKHVQIVLVTDAGTPGISDPGSFFIHKFRSVYPQAQVVPVPGPSAVIAALSVSGFPASHFEFLGFIPHKKGRQTLFSRISDLQHTIVMYESPHRIMKTLESLAEGLGERKIMIAREITKQFEEYPVGTAKELLEYYKRNTEKQRGEFVIVIEPKL